MSYELCSKIKDIMPYEPIAGEYRIRLDANESFFTLPDSLKQEIRDAVSSLDFNRYPDPTAGKLCEAFAKRFGISPEYVTAGNGSDELIAIIIGSFLEKGEGILTFDPDFSMYGLYGEIYGYPVSVLPKKAYRIDVNEAISYINTHDIKMVIFSNPCNPTSLGLDKRAVQKLVSSVNALVVLDEAYMDFWGQSESLLREVQNYDNLLILKTCSKAVGIAALRIGFAVANKNITRALRAVKSPYNLNTVSQTIGQIVLEKKDYLDYCEAKIMEEKAFLETGLLALAKRHGLIDEVLKGVTNFVMLRTAKADEIWKQLLSHSISVRKFPGHLRITAGSSEENKQLLSVLDKILSELEG